MRASTRRVVWVRTKKHRGREMTSSKLVEAIVMANSTCLMQMEAFRRNPADPVQVAIDLSAQVFRLPARKRTYAELEKELEALFMKELGLSSLPGLVAGMGRALTDPAGPKEALVKTIVASACRKMGLKVPGEASLGMES